MTYEERIEKIKASFGHDSRCRGASTSAKSGCHCYLDERARAADAVWLEAIEEPTLEMTTAGAEELTNAEYDDVSHITAAEICWEEMHAAIPRAPAEKDGKS